MNLSWKKILVSALGGILCFVLVIALLIGGFIAWFAISAIPKVYSGSEHYHMIYDNVDQVNKTLNRKYDTLLGFGEYTYHSHLLLFPREQPENLKEFEYYWSQGIDYDAYSIYFSYELDDEEYQTFKEGLSGFSISCKMSASAEQMTDRVHKPVYTEDLFEYPAYIFTWGEDTESFGCCEYILLDDENHTVVNVFMMLRSLDEVQEKASYRILPKNNDQDAVQRLVGGDVSLAKDRGYCVYIFSRDDGSPIIPALNELEYSLDFMPQH